MIQIAYMPSGPDPVNFDERTRWLKYASVRDADERVNFSDEPITNAQYIYRANRILEAQRCSAS